MILSIKIPVKVATWQIDQAESLQNRVNMGERNISQEIVIFSQKNYNLWEISINISINISIFLIIKYL